MRHSETPTWSRLDNAAKIFPSNSSVRDSKVFRFVCQLREPVDPASLQAALDRTMPQFPLYRSVLKRGVFWYYFEDSDLRPVAEPERRPPCTPIYSKDRRNLLFRVLYYDCRISLEVFHALSDGTGALQFLRWLVYWYLVERYPDKFPAPLPKLRLDASHSQMYDDSFQKYYEKPRRSGPALGRTAFRVRADRQRNSRVSVVEGAMPVADALALARQYGVTLTEFMTAVLILAVHDGMRLRDRARPVAIAVPVNLRSFFPSSSARNFFATIDVAYDFSHRSSELADVAAYVHDCFRKNLSEPRMRERMNRLCALEHSWPMRIVPLALKDPVLRVANQVANRTVTAAFSNVGTVTMPPEMTPYIRQFIAFASPNKLQASACSYGGEYVVAFAGPYASHEVERAFFRSLAQLGLDVAVTNNLAQLETEG
jgi:hypothetical protein